MSYFDQYSGAAGAAADRYGIDRSIFYGLIDQESSWNPNADAPTSTAFGFTQLLKGTASDLGVNRLDPIQNLNGGAKYLSQQLNRFGGDYTMALAAYHDGPGAVGKHGGFDYAKSVLGKAKKFAGNLAAGEGLLAQGARALAQSNPISGSILMGTDMLGLTGADSCGIICQIQNWIKESGFFQRLALAILAFIVLFAAFYLMKGNSILETVRKGVK